MIELYLLIMLGAELANAHHRFDRTNGSNCQPRTPTRNFHSAKIQNELKQGRAPTQELVEGAMIVVGGLVLLTPGSH